MHQAEYIDSASCTMQLVMAMAEHGPGSWRVCRAFVSQALEYHRIYLIAFGWV